MLDARRRDTVRIRGAAPEKQRSVRHDVRRNRERRIRRTPADTAAPTAACDAYGLALTRSAGARAHRALRPVSPQAPLAQPGVSPNDGAGPSSRTDFVGVAKSPVFIVHAVEWIFSIIVMATASNDLAYVHARGRRRGRVPDTAPLTADRGRGVASRAPWRALADASLPGLALSSLWARLRSWPPRLSLFFYC